MVKRVKQHQLEDESKTKFQLAIPKQWVTRWKTENDYGIDGEVEIFDEDGYSTGLMFFIQLKATESKEEKTIKSYNLKIDRIKYYKSLTTPVLIVRYSKELDNFYCKWNYEIDLFYAKQGAKTIKVNFCDDDIWNQSFIDELRSHLKKLRAVKSSPINLPVTININSKSSIIGTYPISIFISKIKISIKENFKDLLKYEDSNDKSLLNATIENNDIMVKLSSISGCVIHNAIVDDADDVVKSLAIAAASSLSRFGQSEIAAKILLDGRLKEIFIQNPELLIYNIPLVINSSLYPDIIDLVCEAMENNISDNLLEMVVMYSIILIKSANIEENGATQKLLENCLKKSINLDSTNNIGSSYYNLGNHFYANKKYRDAIKNYLLARKFHKEYSSSYYYHQELAASLFLLGKYKFAAYFYKIAIEKGASENVKPLYADALMFSGDYKLSYEVFRDHLVDIKNHIGGDEWILKRNCLNSLIKQINVGKQYRLESLANQEIGKIDFTKTETHLLVEEIWKIIHMDSLNSLAWFNLGIINCKLGNNEEACFNFVMASLINSQDIESWVNSALLCFSSEEMMVLFQNIINVAYFHNGDNFLVELHQQLSVRVKDKDIIANTMNIIKNVIDVSKESSTNKKNPQFRIMDKNGVFKNIFEEI